ncbi:MAG TPA: ABC transporter permease [Bryobacteraceae bacterium]|nr:ABC transporter permease [Bryobacteraceae bacterium]
MSLSLDLLRDARYALHGMRRAPGFTAVALLTLALGIGANTAIFSVLYAVWLAPAPYAHPDRLVDLSMQQLTGHRFLGGTSYPNLLDWKTQTTVFAAFGVHRYTHQVNVTGSEGAAEVIAHRVSANLFGMLGARPLLGRPMDADADLGAGRRQALIGYRWWQARFGGDPAVVGRPLQVDGETFTIAGVMPAGFEFPPMGSADYRPVVWLSLNLAAEEQHSRDSHALDVIARLKPDASLPRARAEMDTVAARLAAAYPREVGGWGVRVGSLTDVRQLENVRPALLLVMAAASLVLLIACGNMANLLMARAAGRAHEMAVRRALGGTWSRLARQLLTESAVLAVIGGGAGVLLAFLALPPLKSVLPAGMPRAPEIGLSFPVLVFAAAASLLTGLLFGTVPALRPGAALDLAAGRRVLSPRHRTSRFLVTVEVALALVLLSSAGLLLESLRRAWHVDLGFRKDTLTMRLQLSSRAYPDAHRVRAFRQELLRRVCALPGVEYAGTVSSLPLGIIMQGTGFVVAGRPETERESPFASYANVSRDYLRAIGIPLVAGRYFGDDDTPAGPPVAIVSESLARDWWPRREALGKRIRFDNTWFTIVGIAKDVRQDSPERPARRQIYALNEQLPESSQGAAMGRFNVLAVRTTGDPVAVVAAVRRAVADIDKNQPVAAVETMERLVEHSLAARRLNTLLLSLFAGLAVTLAAVGVFGLASYAVTRRTREIGIRMALGATPASVLAMVARESLLLAIAGAAIGLGATMAISRFLARFLFGVKPLDPEIVGAVAIVLVAIVVGSGLFPARRAMRVDPVVALRQD